MTFHRRKLLTGSEGIVISDDISGNVAHRSLSIWQKVRCSCQLDQRVSHNKVSQTNVDNGGTRQSCVMVVAVHHDDSAYCHKWKSMPTKNEVVVMLASGHYWEVSKSLMPVMNNGAYDNGLLQTVTAPSTRLHQCLNLPTIECGLEISKTRVSNDHPLTGPLMTCLGRCK